MHSAPRVRHLLGLLAAVGSLVGTASCSERGSLDGAAESSSGPPTASDDLAKERSPALEEKERPPAPAHPTKQSEPLPGRIEGCPSGMVRVAGEYCPAVMQDCLEHHQEYVEQGKVRHVSERCLRYREPSRCVSKKRRPLDFCMDRYEYPNERGAVARVLTSWREAKALCEQQGKRLCTEDEFNFACEGPEMLPYSYGYVRDQRACNIDKPYRYPDHSRVLPTYETCLATPWCKEELERLDQREPIGQRPSCVSWAGVFDLNGNVNEWVELPGKKPPDRSGLKGGWWGPIRSRCRPTVTFHKEGDYGYEVGLRCCAGAAAGG